MAEAFNINAVGKRKSAVARVYLRPGNGRIVVNQKEFQDYFPLETTRNLASQPLVLVNAGSELDILVNVQGGGPEGQAGGGAGCGLKSVRDPFPGPSHSDPQVSPPEVTQTETAV